VKGIKEMSGVVFQSEADLGLEAIGEQQSILMEGILGNRSTFLGKTLHELNFEQRYGVLILAVHRQGENLRENFQDVELTFGDTLLVQGPPEAIHRLMQERDFLSLTEPTQRAFRRRKAPLAVAGILSVIVFAAFHVLPIAALALIAAILRRPHALPGHRGSAWCHPMENSLHDFRHARARYRHGKNRRCPSHRQRRHRGGRPLRAARDAFGDVFTRNYSHGAD
jgi:TrkA-C domain